MSGKPQSRRGFTLVELLIVVGIIGMLAIIGVSAYKSAAINSRNAKRKGDLLQLSKALEMYANDHGGTYPSTSGNWYGNCSYYGSRPNTDPGSWIPGLVSGGYIPVLPSDPRSGVPNDNSLSAGCKTAPTHSCYLYFSNSINYKILTYCTVEGSIPSTDPFYEPNPGGNGYTSMMVTSDRAATASWF